MNGGEIKLKIIKTNLSVNFGTNEIIDHQSYVEEEDSWEEFVKKVKSGYLFSHQKNRYEISNLKYDKFHLSCDLLDRSGRLTKHLAIVEGHVRI